MGTCTFNVELSRRQSGFAVANGWSFHLFIKFVQSKICETQKKNRSIKPPNKCQRNEIVRHEIISHSFFLLSSCDSNESIGFVHGKSKFLYWNSGQIATIYRQKLIFPSVCRPESKFVSITLLYEILNWFGFSYRLKLFYV
jgi:hypothetical protein